MTQYLFRAKTSEGFLVKVISEYLSFNIKFPSFNVTSFGISLRCMDQNNMQLIDIDWPKDSYALYKAPKSSLSFSVNSSHLYRLLKPIKKKDAVIIFINESSPMKLGIMVERNDEDVDRETTFINISYKQPVEIDLPEGYDNSITITSKKFQKLKALQPIGNEMKIKIIGQMISFFVNGKNLFSKEFSLGRSEEDETKEYYQTFETQLITQLTKCANQNGNIQLFYDDELPLKCRIKTGSLGTLTVYIKSKELIDMMETALDSENDKSLQDQNDEEEPSEDKIDI